MDWFNLDDTVNLLSMIGAAAILILTVVIAGNYLKMMKDSRSEGELVGDSWDGIGEYKNDLPTGWAVVYAATIVWAFWYWFVGYPLNAYSQIGEWNEEVASHKAKYESKYAKADKATLVQMGQSLYLVQCAPCHGETAEGMNGKAQNLLTWGKEEHIIATVAKGAQGLGFAAPMPPNMTDADGAKKAAAYIMATFSPNKATKTPELVAGGKEVYEQTCAACHGSDGKGVPMVAPSLTNLVQVAMDMGKHGAIGVMPNFKGRNFAQIQYDALSTYIYSLK